MGTSPNPTGKPSLPKARYQKQFGAQRRPDESVHAALASASATTVRIRHAAAPGRVALLRRQHHDDRAHLHAAVEVDHILIGHADAAGGDGLPDIFGLVGAMDAEQRVLAA